MTDQNGNPVARHDYLPFGVEIPSGYAGRPGQWGTADNVSAKFTGQERDTETGLDFFQARYHGSAQARFLSPDPLGNFVASAADPQSWNMYAYARNNPLTLVDPTGLDYCDWGDGVLDDDPAIGGSTQAQCEEWGGTWFVPTINDTVDSTMGGQVTYTDPTLDEDALDPGFTFYAFGSAAAFVPGIWSTPSASAPNNGTPWYKNSCVTSALKTGALNAGIDAIGFIPEAGGVARMFGHGAGYRGVVADQLGHGVINAVGKTAGTVNSAAGVSSSDWTSWVSAGITIGDFIPVVNEFTTVAALSWDSGVAAYKVYQCPK
jgi:RHS repeat-associated protein